MEEKVAIIPNDVYQTIRQKPFPLVPAGCQLIVMTQKRIGFVAVMVIAIRMNATVKRRIVIPIL